MKNNVLSFDVFVQMRGRCFDYLKISNRHKPTNPTMTSVIKNGLAKIINVEIIKPNAMRPCMIAVKDMVELKILSEK